MYVGSAELLLEYLKPKPQNGTAGVAGLARYGNGAQRPVQHSCGLLVRKLSSDFGNYLTALTMSDVQVGWNERECLVVWTTI